MGQAAGWVVNVGGVTVYHTGDTCLFSDIELIAKRTPLDVALLCIGGHYTMDRHDAVVAAELTGASTVIPMHYDTFPPIETDADAWEGTLAAESTAAKRRRAAGQRGRRAFSRAARAIGRRI